MNASAASATFALPLPTTAAAASASRIRPHGTVLLRWRTAASPSVLSPAFRARAAVREGLVDPSFYDLLGVPPTATLVEIKKAHKQLAEEYTRRFIEVQEAYETLSDPVRHALYDRDLARGEEPLAFSSLQRFDEEQKEMEDGPGWRNNWQNQLEELRSRRTNDPKDNLSWGSSDSPAKS